MGKEAITKELEKRRIPELLRLSDNTPVDTPQLWETRRKEIRGMLQKECYGYIPESGWVTEWETVSEEENAFGGKARMRTVDVRIRFLSLPADGSQEYRKAAAIFVPELFPAVLCGNRGRNHR